MIFFAVARAKPGRDRGPSDAVVMVTVPAGPVFFDEAYGFAAGGRRGRRGQPTVAWGRRSRPSPRSPAGVDLLEVLAETPLRQGPARRCRAGRRDLLRRRRADAGRSVSNCFWIAC